ncbi:MAG: hypothetical protein QM736_24270 [Vicinamibacterales bacterium]
MSTITDALPPTMADVVAPETTASGPVHIDKSLVDLACLGDRDALTTILRQFIDAGEPIEWCDYLGTLGIQPFGLKSFAVLTPRRIGTLRIGWFGHVMYQDAPLEYTVSGLVAQPSKFGLYVWLAVNTLIVMALDFVVFAALTPFSIVGIVALVLLPVLLAAVWLATVRFYYAFNKCGLLWAVREGLWVYAFTNRGRMNVANRLHRRTVDMRERRIRDLSPLP